MVGHKIHKLSSLIIDHDTAVCDLHLSDIKLCQYGTEFHSRKIKMDIELFGNLQHHGDIKAHQFSVFPDIAHGRQFVTGGGF